MDANLKLPEVVYADGKTSRQHAIAAAQAWQRKVALENTPTPSEVYVIVRDLLAEFSYKELMDAN